MSPSDARCPKDGSVLEVVEVVSTSGKVSLLCPECGSRYLPMAVSAGDNDVMYETWSSGWGASA